MALTKAKFLRMKQSNPFKKEARRRKQALKDLLETKPLQSILITKDKKEDNDKPYRMKLRKSVSFV